MENKRAREPTGAMHTGQPPGMHSMMNKGREENKEGTSDALSAWQGNSAIKSYSGISELEKKSVGFKEALET